MTVAELIVTLQAFPPEIEVRLAADWADVDRFWVDLQTEILSDGKRWQCVLIEAIPPK